MTKQDVLMKALDCSKPADEQMFGCSTKCQTRYSTPIDYARCSDQSIWLFKLTDDQMFGCLDVFSTEQVRCFAQS